MQFRYRKQDGFISVWLVDFYILILAVSLLLLLIMGNWFVRITTVSLVGGLVCLAYLDSKRNRFRIGDKVTINLGAYAGSIGEVETVLREGRGARVLIQTRNGREIVDFKDCVGLTIIKRSSR